MESVLHSALRLMPLGEAGHYESETDPRYANMIGPYGGWLATILLKAILETSTTGMAPKAMTVNFVGAVADGAFQVIARPTRLNRSTEFWRAELVQNGQVCVEGLFTLAAPRAANNFTERLMPDAPAPESVPTLHRAAPLRWLTTYDMRLVKGMPFSAGESSHSINWVRHADGSGLDWLGLAAMCDTMMPRIFFRQATVSPISTVTLTAYFHATAEELATAGADFVLVDAVARRGEGGFFDQESRLFGRAGALLATTEQLVWYK